jgi:carboxyl-terminal processing protease
MNRKFLAAIVGFGLVVGVMAARPSASWRGFGGGPALFAGISAPAEGAQGNDKLAPNPDDRPVANIVARILASSHYNHHPLDQATSSKLLDRFLDTLDPLHLYLTQEDLAEWETVRPVLGEEIMRKGETSQANTVFRRFLKRFDENVAYVEGLLKTEQFTFTGDEKYSLDRKETQRPKDLEAAKEAWKQRLRYEYLQEKLAKQKPEEIVKTLTRRYQRNARALHDLDRDDVFEFYLTALSQVFDPHSGYMGKASLANFNIQMRLSLAGIGAQLRSEDGYAMIAELVPGGPAIRGGKLKVGDKVVAVAQGNGEPVDVVDMKIDHVVEKIRGPKGTEVRLTVIPADATDSSIRKVIPIIRDEVKLVEQEAKAKVVDVPDGPNKTLRLGVIDLPSFYEDVSNRDYGGKSTTNDVRKLVEKLKKEHVDGIVLDLRRNPGGSLTEAINCTGLFIKDGPVVQVKSSGGRPPQVDDDPDPKMQYGGPLIVLTSKLSASASEILAGALQDYGRAVIVGDTSTHGKGTVQSLIQLGPIMQDRNIDVKQDPGALKLTIQKFYRPSGSSTQVKGVASDIVLPSVTSVADIGEDSLPNPLPWDTISAAPFTKLNTVTPYLSELRTRSESRVSADRDFSLIKEEMARFKKTIADKSVSLNEQQRLKEKAEAEALAETRKKLRKENALHPQRVSTLKLSDVEKPGLPPFEVEKAPKPKTATPDPDADGTDESADILNDVSLREAQRILVDLIHLSKTPTTAAVAPKKK